MRQRSLNITVSSDMLSPYQGGWLHKGVQFGATELQTDDVQYLVPRSRLIVLGPMMHGHGVRLLRVQVHHIHLAPGSYQRLYIAHRQGSRGDPGVMADNQQ